MKVVGMEGRWTDGSLFNSGTCAVEYEGTIYNATLGWETSEEEVQRCVDKGSLYLLPEPIDLGEVRIEDWEREKAPFLFGYRVVNKHVEGLIEQTANHILPAERAEFNSPKHDAARWLVFRSFAVLQTFGRVMAQNCLDELSDATDDELVPWFNAITIASGMDINNPDMNDLRIRAGKALRESVKRKQMQGPPSPLKPDNPS